MNEEWRRKYTEAYARYSNLKDKYNRCDGLLSPFVSDQLDRALCTAETELKQLDKELRESL